ncbi:YihA family ribosome biogenesis GTP-binding protein [Paenibacillus lycopersici]|uniref:Probable GTP-binding protein EngB n=1 Tax=Paenibacillus lycopersici TaxID=2704462 RepID=A0A6C0G146_9BACL|nr:ribosome biogenesis GTP-binding protein YihA/YsxC [Paenibacillus lycopersici]QHT62092.1 YihA family ribosome biogenesis GTP-binding protein [Paenibacillus lycopersici]
MKIMNAEFIISAVRPDQYPDDALPEFALAGRSNVGKSSLINRMINRKNLARTSSQPGKTQQLNYYRVNDSVYLVDFPGYGYAKVSKVQRQQFGTMIETFLSDREPLRMVLLIVDIRHAPSKDDILMYDWLKHYEIPVCVVTTKADKVPKSQWPKQVKMIKQELSFHPEDRHVLFSSETGLGREELWDLINEVIEQTNEEAEETEEVSIE